MSKLVPNVVDTARIMRVDDFTGKFSSNHTSICLTTPYMVFEVMKREPRGRFFADRTMIALSGGPWFIEAFKRGLVARSSELIAWHLKLEVAEILAKDLFSYRTCSFNLVLDHPTRRNPIALQLVQKARLFAIADEILAKEIAAIN